MLGGILNGEAKGGDGFLRDYVLFTARIGEGVKIVFPSTIKGRAILGFRVLPCRFCISSGDSADDEKLNGLLTVADAHLHR
jgi:hypothetical protein